MNIKEIKEISNYRNLSGRKISFNSTLNYLIGENNIGKTNILELLNAIFSLGKFTETDFFDITEPIRIVYTLEYNDASIGFFEDNFDVDNSNAITLVAKQDVIDGRISYYHDTPNMTGTCIAGRKACKRKVYFIRQEGRKYYIYCTSINRNSRMFGELEKHKRYLSFRDFCSNVGYFSL